MMIRKVISAILFAFCAVGVSAQMETTRTITGMVIDKNGNPLVGAEVRATGGAETVFTEADGTFSIEVPIMLKSLTASYAGMSDRKLKTTVANQMIFTMKPTNRTFGFVDIVGGGSAIINSKPSVDGMIPQLGLMGGAYRSWGGYFKIVIGFAGPKVYYAGYTNGVLTYLDECRFGQMPLMTGGAIKRINKNCNLFFGLGMGTNYNIWKYSSNGVYSDGESYRDSHGDAECDWAGAVEAGFMYHYRKLNVLAGLTYVTPAFDGKYEYVNTSGSGSRYDYDSCNDGNFNFVIGVGLNF